MYQASFQDPGEPSLPLRGAVDIWNFRAQAGGAEILDEDERRRLDVYKSPQARQLFLSGRAGVRLVAARYSGLAPEGFRLRSDAQGKPSFVPQEDLHFNLSHSGDIVMAAFSSDPIGLDIECCGRSKDFQAIACRFFLPEEADFVSQAGADCEEVFLRIWTAKEAIVKLTGEGLAGGLAMVRTTPDGQGFLGDQVVYLRQFVAGNCYGTAASFFPFEVKGWFDL